MLRHAFTSPKLAALARKLNIERCHAVGVLEHLWYFTATQAPRGDVGRWTDDEIAAGIDWRGDPAELVRGLVDSRWLDRCAEHRLLVHDWADHCDQTVKRSPQVRNSGFCKLVASGSLASDASAASVVEQLTCGAQDSLSLSPEPVPEPVPEPGGPGGNAPPQAAPLAKENASRASKKKPETEPPETLTEEQFADLEDWARREMPGEATAVRHHVACCLDHFRGKRRPDWIATCRNWIRKAPEMRRPGSKGPPQSVPVRKPSQDELREYARRLREIEFERRTHGEI